MCVAKTFFMLPLRYDQPGIQYDAGWRYDSAVAQGRMNRMIKPKLELARQGDNELMVLATAVKNAMTANAAEFPGSAAAVTALGTAITAYTASLQAAADGKMTQQALVDAKDADRVAVEDALRTLAGQVTQVANGDVNVIHDAGMQGQQRAGAGDDVASAEPASGAQRTRGRTARAMGPGQTRADLQGASLSRHELAADELAGQAHQHQDQMPVERHARVRPTRLGARARDRR
jgi:hypothetical protein